MNTQKQSIEQLKSDFKKFEFIEILRNGFWPVKILQQEYHWIADGHVLDDSGVEYYHTGEPFGYDHFIHIVDEISIGISIYQGDCLESESANTELRFWMCDDSHKIACDETYVIESIFDLDNILKNNWPEFLKNIWPQVNKHLISWCGQPTADLDCQRYNRIVEFVWKEFEQELYQDLLRFNFNDGNWSALDTIENWIKK
jgi:hypothetical protein